MKRIWLVVGAIALAVVAFFTGWMLSRPMLFGPPNGFESGPQGPGGFREFQAPGETFIGSVIAVEDGQITIGNESEEFSFEITPETRLVVLGEVDGLQIGDAVEVIYQSEDGILVALSITSTN